MAYLQWIVAGKIEKEISMNKIVPAFLIIIILAIALTAYFLVLNVLFPTKLAKSKRVLAQLPGRSFWIGLINLIFFALIAIMLFSLAGKNNGLLGTILSVPALLIAGALLAALSFGWSAMVNQVSERLFPEFSLWKKVALGTFLLSFGGALPFAGWFLLLPYTGCSGLGAVILGFFQKENPE